MKIENDATRALRQHEGISNNRGTATLAVKGADATPAVGSVSISDTSRTLQSVGGTEAPFDAKRVEAIKAAITAGHFKVDPHAVADKLIDSVGQLLTSKS